MPSSKCNQISLLLGELYNDVRLCAGNMSPNNDKILRKQFAECAHLLDLNVEEAEKNCFNAGYDTANDKPINLPPPPEKSICQLDCRSCTKTDECDIWKKGNY